jgi:hypothetical protein
MVAAPAPALVLALAAQAMAAVSLKRQGGQTPPRLLGATAGAPEEKGSACTRAVGLRRCCLPTRSSSRRLPPFPFLFLFLGQG